MAGLPGGRPGAAAKEEELVSTGAESQQDKANVKNFVLQSKLFILAVPKATPAGCDKCAAKGSKK
jgi:hypothetical protein